MILVLVEVGRNIKIAVVDKMIDFHLHSTFSDGTYTPEELVGLASEKKIKAIALTDHDTISGIKRGKKAAVNKKIDFISGIEFSADLYGKEIHILGLFIDENNPRIINLIEELKKDRLDRTEIILEKLANHKIYIDKKEILQEVKSDLISRTHIADKMREKGYIRSHREAFTKYLGSGGRAYLPKDNLTPERAVEVIKEVGGLAFIAHPKLIRLRKRIVLDLIYKLMNFGLDGLEVYYPGFTPQDRDYYEKICKENNLIMTGGSDFHGKNRGKIDVGAGVAPDILYEEMKKRRAILEEK